MTDAKTSAKTRLAVGLLMSFSVAACELEDGGGGPECVSDLDCNGDRCVSGACESGPAFCTVDWDCRVLETCGDAGLCEPADAFADRDFGQVMLTSDGVNDVFLVWVYALPTGEGAAEGFAAFELVSDAGAMGAVGNSVRNIETNGPHDTWAGRIAYETQRRQQIDAIVADLRAGRRVVSSSSTRQGTCSCAANQACVGGSCLAVGEQGSITFPDGVTNPTLTVQYVGTTTTGDVGIDVLLDANNLGAEADAIAATNAFADTIGGELSLLGISGHDGELDRNGDGRLAVVFTDQRSGIVTPDIIAFFAVDDFERGGNEADLLWALVPQAGVVAQSVGNLVHEYVHLASYGVRVQARNDAAQREVQWLSKSSTAKKAMISGVTMPER